MTAHITFTTDMTDNQYVVYTVRDGATGRVEYVGLCKLNHLFQLPDYAQRAGACWNGSKVIFVTKTCKTKAEALKEQYARAKEYDIDLTLGNRIECIETGETWYTLKEAAAAHNIDQAALSRHLRNLPGHVSIKGKRYRRV